MRDMQRNSFHMQTPILVAGEEDEEKSSQAYLRKVLPSYRVPRRVKYEPIAIGHRFKTR